MKTPDHPQRDPTMIENLKDKIPSIDGRLNVLNNNMTFVFLGLMWVTFVSQFLVMAIFGSDIAEQIFVLHSDRIDYVWTWFTSIFAHGDFWHIAINSIVLFFFGPLTERRIGTKRFTILFLGGGIIAGLSQVGLTAVMAGSPGGVVGASGAVAAILGLITILNPKMRVYLWFILPLPLWIITGAFIGYSAWMSLTGGIGAGGVAQLAHLMGAVVGLIYGIKVKREGVAIPDQFTLNGSGGPGGSQRPGNGRF